jgi:hypothetical protein
LGIFALGTEFSYGDTIVWREFLSLDWFYYVSKGRRCGYNGREDKEGHELLLGGRRVVL